MFVAQEAQQLHARVVLLDDSIADVGTVEAGHEDARLAEAKAFDDLGARLRIGRGGERDARHIRKALVQHGQLDVLGAEVVAPLRHAMRLVDGEQRQSRPFLQAFQQVEKTPGHESFRRDVGDVDLAGQQGALDGRAFSRGLAGIQEGGGDAGFLQRRDLILHKGDQRRDDDAGAASQQRRDLVAHGLAAARGHQHQTVAAVRDVVDNLGLGAAKARVAEYLLQHRQGIAIFVMRIVVAVCGCR